MYLFMRIETYDWTLSLEYMYLSGMDPALEPPLC